MRRITKNRVVAATTAALLLAGSVVATNDDIKNDIKLAFCATDVVAADVVTDFVVDQGFAEGTFDVNPTNTPVESDSGAHHGNAAFLEDGAYTDETLNAYLTGTDPHSVLAQKLVNEKLGDREVDWVLVYFKTAVNIEGITGVVDNEPVNFGTRASGAGEFIWFPVDQSNCQVVDGLVIRAACGNISIRVVPPPACKEECTTPPPPCEYGPPDEDFLCPKSADPNDWMAIPVHVGPGEYTGETPPAVVTTATSDAGITDTALTPIGAETGGQTGGTTEVNRDEVTEVEEVANDDEKEEEVIVNPF